MNEQLRTTNPEIIKLEEAVSYISSTNTSLGNIYRIGLRRNLTEEEREQKKALHRKKHLAIIDLLMLRAREKLYSEVRLILFKHPEEELHHFSMNDITIIVPSTLPDRND